VQIISCNYFHQHKDGDGDKACGDGDSIRGYGDSFMWMGMLLHYHVTL